MYRFSPITHITILSLIAALANAGIAAANPTSGVRAKPSESRQLKHHSEQKVARRINKRQEAHKQRDSKTAERRQHRDNRERAAERRSNDHKKNDRESTSKRTHRSHSASRDDRLPGVSKAVGIAMQNLDDLIRFYEKHERWDEMEWALRRRVELPLLLAQMGPITNQLGEGDAIAEYYRLIDRPDKALEVEEQLLDRQIHRAHQQLRHIDEELALLKTQREEVELNLDQLVKARESLQKTARKFHAHQESEHSESLEREIEGLHREIERLQGELDSSQPGHPKAVAVPEAPTPKHHNKKTKVFKTEKRDHAQPPRNEPQARHTVRGAKSREDHKNKPAADSKARRERPRSIEIKTNRNERKSDKDAPRPDNPKKVKRSKHRRAEPAQM